MDADVAASQHPLSQGEAGCFELPYKFLVGNFFANSSFFISIFKLFFSQMSLGLKPKSWKMIFLDLRKMSSCWWAELRGVGLTQLKPRDPSLADGSRLADTLVQRRPLMGIGSL